uniref:Palmitoyltransferase n=1 Tax=Phallusia mammillata TaxID=59560 RepID=A0A6F9DWT1_9ASCI|nr:ZF(DHHC/FYVE/PHD)-1 zinc finger protein [Phallusia mammillata]
MGWITSVKSLGRLIHFGPLIALFIVFTCYTVAIVDSMVWLWPPRNSLLGKCNVLLLTFWLALILGNFFRAILKGPGYVSKHWAPEKESDKQFLQFCKICQGYKPPRAHHCRICKRCVLKMDHHCPWINNCCGHFNHTNFIMFVFFAPIGCFHAFLVYCATVWKQLFHRSEYLSTAYYPVNFTLNAFIVNLFATGLALGTTFAVGFLFYHQVKSVWRNCTGIEQWIVEKAEDRRDINNEPDFVYPYDLGVKQNLLQVVNMSCGPRGDGITWPVVEGCDQYTLTVEQLQQKLWKRERMVKYIATREYSGRWFPCTQGFCTCIRFPCTDEPRIPLQKGDIVIVSRGNKYWLYGDKSIPDKLVKSGVRERGWFPRRCAVAAGHIGQYDNNDKEKVS